MKKVMKIFSLVMALVLMMTVAVIPTSAAVPSDAHVGFRLELSPETTRVDTNGADPVANNVYRLDVYLTSDVWLSTIIMDINYDPAKFAPLDSCDDYTLTTSRPEGYTDILCAWQGQLLADEEVKSGRDKFYGPSNMNVKTAYKFKFTDKADGVMLWNYKPADKSAMIGNCTDELICSIYLQLKEGATADGAKFDFGSGQGVSSKSVGFNAAPKLEKYLVMRTADFIDIFPLNLLSTPAYTYHEGATPATSPLNRVNTQYKLGADGKSFDLRTISSISVEDMKTLVGATDAATIKANVKALGFVATNDAKVQEAGVKAALAAGGKADYNGKTYVVGTTNTLVATGTDFQFRAMLSSATDRIPADGLKLQAFIQKTDDSFTFYAADLNLTADMIK